MRYTHIALGFVLLCISILGGCTEESRNKFFRDADNILGKDFKVSYVSNGIIVKTWTIRDSKISTGKDQNGANLGYYFFWSEETGYVQVSIRDTIIEEIRQ